MKSVVSLSYPSWLQVFMDMAWDMEIKDMLDLVGQRLRGYESERGTKQSFEYVGRFPAEKD
jgi:hypothetical protein